MGHLTKRSQADFLQSILVTALFSITLAMAPEVGAQGKGSSSSGPSGASVSDSSSTANHGNAVSGSNQKPGGYPGSSDANAFSNGPRGTSSSRQGYLGGRNTEALPSPITVTTLVAIQFRNCPDDGVPPTPSQARLSGENNERIYIVAQYLAQGLDESSSSPHVLLANFQEELEKPIPDLTLAGTYLGITSEVPVTPNLVSEVSASLCVPVTSTMAESIASVAEAQRWRLKVERPGEPRTEK